MSTLMRTLVAAALIAAFAGASLVGVTSTASASPRAPQAGWAHRHHHHHHHHGSIIFHRH
ncbi:MAG: hypothetical protein P4L33_21810 [Capsulimonadaceae bacterium]|nr:hypothetical protein [Capsulimonadaceae bacterium]